MERRTERGLDGDSVFVGNLKKIGYGLVYSLQSAGISLCHNEFDALVISVKMLEHIRERADPAVKGALLRAELRKLALCKFDLVAFIIYLTVGRQTLIIQILDGVVIFFDSLPQRSERSLLFVKFSLIFGDITVE